MQIVQVRFEEFSRFAGGGDATLHEQEAEDGTKSQLGS